MWYAVQVSVGKEETVKKYCGLMVEKEILKECFFLRQEQMKRYEGEWHKEEHPLFPGYVFMISDYPQELFLSLKKIPALTKLLGDCEGAIPLREEEIRFLEDAGGEERIMRMSYGYMIGEQVQILSGPLKGFRGKIVHIDRHKREASILLSFFNGRETRVKVGLEILSKKAGVQIETV